jgi:hypothetical protein
MSIYNYVNRVLIGTGTNSGAITNVAQIQKGDLFLLTEKGEVVADVAAAQALPKHERVVIALGIGNGNPLLSSPIQGNYVSKYEGQSYVAPTQQTVAIGYNGTTGNLTADVGTEYRLRIRILDDDRFNGQRSTILDFNTTIGVGEGPKEAAAKIACLFDQKEYGVSYTTDKVSLSRLANGTLTALPATASVVKGSKTVVSVGHGLTAGGEVFQLSTGETFIVDKIIDTDTFTIDTASTVTAAADVAGTVSGANNWGFKLTAQEIDSFISNGGANPVDEYEYVLFDAVYSEAIEGATEPAAIKTELVPLNPGQGYWKQVNDREEKAKGYLGDTSKRRFHDKRIQSNVIIDEEYASVVITHADVYRSDFQDNINSPLKTEIYIPQGSAQASTEFVDILNGFFVDVVGLAPISL